MQYGCNWEMMATRASSDVGRLEDACRAQGLPVTTQRRAIYEVLAERTDHPTADQIWEVARERLPELSRTTVYRVLDTFVKLGVASKTPNVGAAVRFDPRTERHHHAVCRECDRVVDVESTTLDRIRIPATDDIGFEVDDYSVHIRGLCVACRRRRSRRERTRQNKEE